MLKLPRFSIHAGSTFLRRLRIVTKHLGHAIKKDKKIKIKKSYFQLQINALKNPNLPIIFISIFTLILMVLRLGHAALWPHSIVWVGI